MASPKREQNFANHTKFDPPFHFFLLPVFTITLLATIMREYREPTTWHLWNIVVAIAALVAVALIRSYSLKVQDRVIRLEERLRLATLMAPLPGLTEGQLIALRFASDAEAPALAEKAAKEKLSAKQIKQAIRVWRPDYWRV